MSDPIRHARQIFEFAHAFWENAYAMYQAGELEAKDYFAAWHTRRRARKQLIKLTGAKL